MDAVWVTGTGRRIQVSEMESDHLENTFKYLLRARSPSERYQNIVTSSWVKMFAEEMIRRKIEIPNVNAGYLWRGTPFWPLPERYMATIKKSKRKTKTKRNKYKSFLDYNA